MSEEKQMTRAEWERERAAEVSTKDALTLASKVAALEYDLKTVRAERDSLKDQLPPEGSVVLKGAEKDRWDAYQSLGKPDDLQSAVAERDALKGDMAARDRRESIRAAAEAAGYKAGVLERLAPDNSAFEVREESGEEGQTVKVAYLKTADGQEQRLTEYAQANFADFMPALAAAPAAPMPEPEPQPPLWLPQPTDLTPAPLTEEQLDQQRAASGAYHL